MTRLLICFALAVFGSTAKAQDSLIADNRFVAGLSDSSYADAYPNLSPDGLRLYFTSNRDSGERFYCASRASVEEPFGKPVLVPLSMKGFFFVTSMTADEKTIFIYQYDNFFRSTRASLTEPFGPPVRVRGVEGFAPAASPDGREFLVVHESVHAGPFTKEARAYLQHYTLNDGDSAIADYELLCDQKMKLWPIQFTKDGLSFYMPIHVGEQPGMLARYSRASTKDRFDDKRLIDLIVTPAKLSQVTLSGDGTLLVGVSSLGNKWNDDDLVSYRLVRTVCLIPGGLEVTP